MSFVRAFLASSHPYQGLHNLAAAVASLQQSGQQPWLACSSSGNHIHSPLTPAVVQPSAIWRSNRCVSSSSSSSNTSSQVNSDSSSQSEPQTVRAPTIKELRAQIFEQHIGDGRRSGRKAILKPLQGRTVASWYFTLTGPQMHLFDDPIEEE